MPQEKKLKKFFKLQLLLLATSPTAAKNGNVSPQITLTFITNNKMANTKP